MAVRVDFNNLWSRIDRVFRGRYEYRGRLGSGGMGLVFLVQATDLGGRLYALKVIDKHSPENSGIDVYAEIQILKALRHPGIVSIFEAMEDERYVFIIQDFIQGRTLAELRDDTSLKGMVDEEVVRLWMIDVADALAYIHSMNIVHRDIKPGNIMIDSDGSARLIDFGIARRISTLSNSSSGTTVGSAPYSPLERLEGYGDNIQTDIYAYGTTFYSLLRHRIPSVSGREINTLLTSKQSVKPYYMTAYRTMMDDVDQIRDAGIRELIRDCIDVDPRRRVSDFNTVRYRLRSIDQVSQTHEEKKSEYTRKRRLLSAVLIIGILLAGLGIVQMKRDHDHRYDRIIASADEAYAAADYALSEQAAIRAIEFDPNDVIGYITKYKAQTASAYELNDDSAYRRIISDVANDTRELPALEDDLYTATYLANAYFETGDYENAISTLSKRDDLGDDQQLLLGHALYLNGESDRASECLGNMSGDVPQKYYLEGLIAEESDPDDAIGYYQQVLESYNNGAGFSDLSRKALSQIVQIYMNSQDYEQAIDAINDATGRNAALGESLKISYMLMDCYYQSGDFSKAVSQADVLLERSQQSDVYAIKTVSLINLGSYDEALNAITAWEDAYTDDPRPHIRRVQIYDRIASTSESDADRRRTYPDFIRAYEEEERWLRSHDEINEEFLSLEAPYREAVEILEDL